MSTSGVTEAFAVAWREYSASGKDFTLSSEIEGVQISMLVPSGLNEEAFRFAIMPLFQEAYETHVRLAKNAGTL